MKRNARPSTRGPVSGFLRRAARLVKGLLPKTLACSVGFLCGEIVQSPIAHGFELCNLRRRFTSHTQNLLAKLCRAASAYVPHAHVLRCAVVCGLAMAATDRRVLRRHPSGHAGHPGTRRQKTLPSSKCRVATTDFARVFSRAHALGCTVMYGLAMAATDRHVPRQHPCGHAGHPGTRRRKTPSLHQKPSRNPGRRASLLAHTRWGCTVVHGWGGCRSW